MTVNGRTIPLNALPRIVKTVRNQPAELGGDPSIGSPSRWNASERVSACERMRAARHSCDDDPSESSCSVVVDGEVACHPGDERYTGVGDGGGTTMTAGADRRRRGRNPDSHHRPDETPTRTTDQTKPDETPNPEEVTRTRTSALGSVSFAVRRLSCFLPFFL